MFRNPWYRHKKLLVIVLFIEYFGAEMQSTEDKIRDMPFEMFAWDLVVARENLVKDKY